MSNVPVRLRDDLKAQLEAYIDHDTKCRTGLRVIEGMCILLELMVQKLEAYGYCFLISSEEGGSMQTFEKMSEEIEKACYVETLDGCCPQPPEMEKCTGWIRAACRLLFHDVRGITSENYLYTSEVITGRPLRDSTRLRDAVSRVQNIIRAVKYAPPAVNEDVVNEPLLPVGATGTCPVWLGALHLLSTGVYNGWRRLREVKPPLNDDGIIDMDKWEKMQRRLKEKKRREKLRQQSAKLKDDLRRLRNQMRDPNDTNLKDVTILAAWTNLKTNWHSEVRRRLKIATRTSKTLTFESLAEHVLLNCYESANPLLYDNAGKGSALQGQRFCAILIGESKAHGGTLHLPPQDFDARLPHLRRVDSTYRPVGDVTPEELWAVLHICEESRAAFLTYYNACTSYVDSEALSRGGRSYASEIRSKRRRVCTQIRDFAINFTYATMPRDRSALGKILPTHYVTRREAL